MRTVGILWALFLLLGNAGCSLIDDASGKKCDQDSNCDPQVCDLTGRCVDPTGCDTGYQDNDGDGLCLPDCATSGLDCGLDGTCDDSGGAALCTCDEGYVGDYCDTCAPEYEDFGSGCVLFWVSIPGGMFLMGSDSGSSSELPVHQVTVPAFEMTRTEVTIAQYQACVDAGVCTEPSQCGACYNWGVTGREDHPVNCVDWRQAVDFCGFAGGRLPSEAEWEYAARRGGQDITYPWGDDSPSCTYAVMSDGGSGCGEGRTWSVCGKPAGNTTQGLCDMAGNVWEWVQDWWHDDYIGAPSDGSAWESPSGSFRVTRSGGFVNGGDFLRASHRNGEDPLVPSCLLGHRCAR